MNVQYCISPLTEFQYTQTQCQNEKTGIKFKQAKDTVSPYIMLAYTSTNISNQHSVLMLILHACGATPHSPFFVGGDKQADDG